MTHIRLLEMLLSHCASRSCPYYIGIEMDMRRTTKSTEEEDVFSNFDTPFSSLSQYSPQSSFLPSPAPTAAASASSPPTKTPRSGDEAAASCAESGDAISRSEGGAGGWTC